MVILPPLFVVNTINKLLSFCLFSNIDSPFYFIYYFMSYRALVFKKKLHCSREEKNPRNPLLPQTEYIFRTFVVV